MATTITNANIDTGAAAVAAPWGPLTRVSDVADLPTPNSNIDLEFTDALGTTVFMTYEELIDATRNIVKIAQYEGENFIMETVADQIDALDTAITAYAGPPYSHAEYVATIEALRNIVQIMGYYD